MGTTREQILQVLDGLSPDTMDTLSGCAAHEARRLRSLTGMDAIRERLSTGAVLRAHADPTGASDREISDDEAADLCEQDPSLVYVGGPGRHLAPEAILDLAKLLGRDPTDHQIHLVDMCVSLYLADPAELASTTSPPDRD